MRDFQLPGRSVTHATNGMCATSHPLAAKVAVDIMAGGGNALDAAIGAGVLLGFCEPQSTGIGGDAFILISPAGGDRIVALNGSGRAPAALSAAEMRAKGWSEIPLGAVESVTLPGAIDAFCRANADWGRRTLAEILAPAIRYAEEGVPVGQRVSFDWDRNGRRLQGAARNFMLNNGAAYVEGDIFRAPGQAEVLRRVASEGRAGFYEGEVAEDMVASLRAMGGCHTHDDFAATACMYADPISGDYRGTELVEHPPNGQGATAILMAMILSQFDLGGMEPFGVARTHLETEAAKLAYDARNRFLADPDHTTRLAHMLAPETAGNLAALISPKRALPDPARAAGAVHRDTVYVSTADRDGMAVSLIYSTYYAFGSGLASSKFGINFQNRGCGFTLEEGHANEAGGGKRPMHTIIPGMLRQGGRVSGTFGVMGGSYQPAGHMRVLSNMVDFGLDAQAAIDGPRSFFEDGVVQLERGYAPDIAAGLEALGHKVTEATRPLGGGQMILIDHARGLLTGASDPRKDGCALGY